MMANMFHTAASRRIVTLGRGARLLGGLINSCGGIELCPHHLSAVIGVSVLLEVCCVRPAGAPHRGEALHSGDPDHNVARFHPRAGKKQRRGQTIVHAYSHGAQKATPKAVGTVSCLATLFFNNSHLIVLPFPIIR